MDYLFLDSCYVPNIFALIQFYEFGELVNFGWLLFCLLPEQNNFVDASWISEVLNIDWLQSVKIET